MKPAILSLLPQPINSPATVEYGRFSERGLPRCDATMQEVMLAERMTFIVRRDFERDGFPLPPYRK